MERIIWTSGLAFYAIFHLERMSLQSLMRNPVTLKINLYIQ